MAERARERSLPQASPLRKNYKGKVQKGMAQNDKAQNSKAQNDAAQNSKTQNSKTRAELLPQSGSERRVFRLSKSYGSEILIDASAMGAQARDYLHKLQKLSSFLPQVGLRVPQIKHLDFSNHCVIVEDLGQDSYAHCLRTLAMKDCLLLFERALQSLLRLSQSPLACNNLACNNLACTEQLQGRADVLDTRALLPSFNEHSFVEQVSPFFDYFLLSPNNAQQNSSNATTPTICRRSWQKIWQKLYREAQFQKTEIAIALGDVHTENLFALADAEHGTCAFIDFQDAHFAPRCYDVVSLLEDGLWDMPDDWRERLWADYCDKARWREKREQHCAERHYQLCAMHRDIRMIGILYRLLHKRGRERYGDWLVRVARNCKRRMNRRMNRHMNRRMAEEDKFADLRKFIERVAVNWQQRIEEESRNAPQIVDAQRDIDVPARRSSYG